MIAAGVGLILIMARVRSGAAPHAAWTAVLGAMLLMPVKPLLAPAVGISVQMPAGMDEAATILAKPFPAVDVPVEFSRTPAPGAPVVSGEPVWPMAALVVYCLGVLLFLILA